MTIDDWLRFAQADAERRGLPELKPILEGLARATTALRAADFNAHAEPETSSPPANRTDAAARPRS
jgi:hypothetical protein